MVSSSKSNSSDRSSPEIFFIGLVSGNSSNSGKYSSLLIGLLPDKSDISKDDLF